MHNLSEKMYSIKNKLVDVILLSFAITFLPVSIANLLRISSSGFTFSVILVPIILIIFVVEYIIRKKLDLKVKLITLVSGLFLLAIAGFYSYGLLSMGMSILIIINTITALFTKQKTKIFTLLFSILIIIIFAFAIGENVITFKFDIVDYFSNKSTWYVQIFGFFTISLISVFSVSYMMENLNKSTIEESKSKEQYSSLIEGLEDGMYSIDADKSFISVNKSFENAVGIKRSQLIGKHYSSALSTGIFRNEEYKTLWETHINYVFTHRKSVVFQFAFEGFDKKERVLDVNLIPVFDEDGSVKLLIGDNRDITELINTKKHVEDLLISENEKLEKLVMEKTKELEETMKELMKTERLASLGSLVAGVAHEINTPLGVAVTASSYLSDNNNSAYAALKGGTFGKDDFLSYMKTIDETSEIINTNLYRASELIKNFKEISVNQSSEQATEFNLTEYINSIIITLKHEYKNTPHKISVNFKNDINIYSYPSAFSQILTNLIMNSLTHAFPKEYEGLIDIDCKVTKNSLTLIYKDNGIGIDETSLKRIFDPFYTTNRSKGGSGLGMSIIYNIVTDQLHGTIDCVSRLNIGTIFTINMPLDIDS